MGPDGIAGGADAHVVLVGDGPAGKGAGGGFDIGLGIGADAHGEKLQQFAPVVFVGGVFVVVLVVQPENHRRVAGKFRQQVAEAAQSVAAEGVGLVDDRFGVVQFAVGGGEQTVPEQGDFFLQGAGGVYHPVEPIGLGAFDEHEAVLVYVIAAELGVVPFRGGFGVEQPFYGGFVALGTGTAPVRRRMRRSRRGAAGGPSGIVRRIGVPGGLRWLAASFCSLRRGRGWAGRRRSGVGSAVVYTIRGRRAGDLGPHWIPRFRGNDAGGGGPRIWDSLDSRFRGNDAGGGGRQAADLALGANLDFYTNFNK